MTVLSDLSHKFLAATTKITLANLSSRTILVLEDDPDARALLNTMLSGRGSTVLQASTVGEAQKILEETDINCLVTDFNLGSETATDLLTRLSPENKPGKVVLVSGETFDGPVAGVDVILQKPFRMNKLLESVS